MNVMHHRPTIVYHLGAPQTDNDLLVKSLRWDTDLLAQNGVVARKPSQYRKTIQSFLEQMSEGSLSEELEIEYLQSLTKVEQVDRILLSDSNFLGFPAFTFSGNSFYGRADIKTHRLRNLTPNCPVEFFIAIRDPATFVPALANTGARKGDKNFLGGMNPLEIKWSNVINLIKQANPDCHITVWADEDSPILWPTLLQEFSGLDPAVTLQGSSDMLSSIMTEEGTNRLSAYLEEHPNLSILQRRRIFAIFLDKFADLDQIEEEIELEGWNTPLMEALSEHYDDDMYEIERMQNVTFITP
ncbi:hypothetical protein [Cochlodiniinecator piscidefendens]|uniref:hypothetical protein n=1 Tax=Cochlodiniinecator piscidefendens TaxID=2715756 RepID=UPI0014096F7E|nr:hypothetical protein [Cochlodiniinecator piscidefendens]